MDVKKPIGHGTYLLILAGIFFVEWFLLAIRPTDRQDWLLENVLVVLFVIFLSSSYKKLILSRISYTLIFVFLSIHEIGAHYTYAEVPYDQWTQSWFGFSFNHLVGWQRNNFDRVVHFSYGLLLAYPIREIYFRIANSEGFWGYFLPLDLTMSTSMIFELFEWFAAKFFGGDLGAAYLGTQGDIWDAQKDMALASFGALVAMLVTMALNLYLQKDFAREWSQSLKVKHRRPLGEDEIVRLWRRKKKDKNNT